MFGPSMFEGQKKIPMARKMREKKDRKKNRKKNRQKKKKSEKNRKKKDRFFYPWLEILPMAKKSVTHVRTDAHQILPNSTPPLTEREKSIFLTL